MKYSTFFKCISPWADSYSHIVSSYLLFLHITDNVKAVNAGIKFKNDESENFDNIIPPQRYQKYANGGLSINKLSHKIYNLHNRDKFITFLNTKVSGSVIKNKLYKNFHRKRNELKKENLFENPQNLFDDIADTFLEIIRDAFDAYENSPRNNPRKNPKEIDNATNSSNIDNAYVNKEHIGLDESSLSETGIPKNDGTLITKATIPDNQIEDDSINTSSKNADELAGLNALFNELNSRFMDLDEKGSSLHMSSWLRSEEEQNEKEQEFEIIKSDFINENKKLRLYYLSFPELEEKFEKMISLSRTLTFWYGYKDDEQNHTKTSCDHIEEYRKCIHEVWKMLSK